MEEAEAQRGQEPCPGSHSCTRRPFPPLCCFPPALTCAALSLGGKSVWGNRQQTFSSAQDRNKRVIGRGSHFHTWHPHPNSSMAELTGPLQTDKLRPRRERGWLKSHSRGLLPLQAQGARAARGPVFLRFIQPQGSPWGSRQPHLPNTPLLREEEFIKA